MVLMANAMQEVAVEGYDGARAVEVMVWASA